MCDTGVNSPIGWGGGEKAAVAMEASIGKMNKVPLTD